MAEERAHSWSEAKWFPEGTLDDLPNYVKSARALSHPRLELHGRCTCAFTVLTLQRSAGGTGRESRRGLFRCDFGYRHYSTWRRACAHSRISVLSDGTWPGWVPHGIISFLRCLARAVMPSPPTLLHGILIW